jgi:hypothetical protein
MTFASRSVAVHLLRGGVGFALLAVALAQIEAHAGWSLVAFVLGVVALRGCPMCWTLGLLETLAARARGDATAGACGDGSCATVWRREP